MTDCAQRLFDAINEHTIDSGPGITRPSYSAQESRAMVVVAKEALELGCRVGFDASWNLHCILPGLHTTEIVMGSHLDSVPSGGPYDGVAGVVAGLLALRGLKSVARRHHTTRLIVLRGEESAWFGKCYLGSLGLFGKLTDADLQLQSKYDGATLARHRDCTQVMGFAKDLQCDLKNFRAFVEVHIEQGPVLHQAGEPIGIVSAIRGNHRYPHARITGEAGHSGTTPMAGRRDAVASFAELISRLDALVEGSDRRLLTCGSVQTPHGSMTTIADLVEFALEFRADEADDLNAIDESLQRIVLSIMDRRGTAIDLGRKSVAAPVTLDKNIRNVLGYHGGLTTGARVSELSSGAGHDAAVFQQAGVPTGMIFIRNEHGSHNPRESMRLDDFLLATEVLTRTLADTVL